MHIAKKEKERGEKELQTGGKKGTRSMQALNNLLALLAM